MAFKSPEAVIRSALTASTAVSSIVSSRIYPVIAPANASLPLITFRRSSVRRSQSLSGPVGSPSVVLDLDIYATTYESARELADRCRLVLDGYGGTVNNVEVSNTSLENEFDGFVQLAGGDVPPVYSVTQVYSVLWQET